MKYGLTLAFIVFVAIARAQSARSTDAQQDSTVNCVTYWDRGEIKTYSIVHDKITTLPGGKPQPFHFAYEARVTVVDQTEKDYTIQWKLHIPQSLRGRRPGLVDSLPIFEGMQLIYKISDVGAFQELVNWEEVRDDYSRLMVLSLPPGIDSAGSALEETRAMFKSRGMVEATLTRELQLFHTPFGYSFSTAPVNIPTSMTTPFSRTPLAANQIFEVTDISAKNDEYTLLIRQSVDKQKAPRSLELEDLSEYRFNKTTGWLQQLSYKRTAIYGETSQSDSFTITLLK